MNLPGNLRLELTVTKCFLTVNPDSLSCLQVFQDFKKKDVFFFLDEVHLLPTGLRKCHRDAEEKQELKELQ